ncbi:type II toxin-antitoxin system HicA family toxin [Longimicrobium sp.]|uniref:type II toxin-antitoxin system HicA family toxin n=1 Tax=Longimicrobium sp. TaxID=2029185 RepID=UPI002CA3BB91|nr:type II toxin-antitoxin system HicA family toxin [Longimicrobium sp.]HSU15635.1 type II toxin-antitoxin system HicA family toxin [Longimicrobium sp.]
MADCEKLLEAARANPAGLRIAEACTLAECFGWTFARQAGSHRLYKRQGNPNLMNFQEDRNGKAKAYQVRQLIAAIEELGTEGQDDEV